VRWAWWFNVWERRGEGGEKKGRKEEEEAAPNYQTQTE